MEEVITGNVFDKYHTGNPVYRRLMRGFFRNLIREIRDGDHRVILEVGCGEGLLAAKILEHFPGVQYRGLDINGEIIEEARGNCPGVNFEVANAYDLKSFTHEPYDLVILSEVLEHLDQPEKALQEISWLTFKRLIITVPHEPLWRILNIMRLKYWNALGNTPGHLQHFNKGSLSAMLSKYFHVGRIYRVLPWIFAACK